MYADLTLLIVAIHLLNFLPYINGTETSLFRFTSKETCSGPEQSEGTRVRGRHVRAPPRPERTDARHGSRLRARRADLCKWNAIAICNFNFIVGFSGDKDERRLVIESWIRAKSRLGFLAAVVAKPL